MKHTIILDFMGVVADTNYLKLVSSFSLKEKYRALRVLAALKTNREIRSAFSSYQKGLINVEELEQIFSKYYPKQAYMVPILLNRFMDFTTINHKVLEMVQTIRSQGSQVILMSNATPEVLKVIREEKIDTYFDGLILSNELQMKKPSPEIYKYAIKTYNFEPEYAVMIDDSSKNLATAGKFGITPIIASSSQETYKILNELLEVLDFSYI